MLSDKPTIQIESDVRVALSHVTEYDAELLEETVRDHFSLLETDISVWKGKTVVLKPNLLLKFAPERAATVHPTLVEAVGRIFVSAGARVILAESPGGPYNSFALEGIYKTSGMIDAAKRGGFELNRDFSWKPFRADEGKKIKEFDVITPIYEADLIVNLCKLKSHAMATMTAGTKNLFGVIPGTEKVEFHARFKDMKDFSAAVVDLTSAIAARTPLLTVCDAIIGMEGNGPSAGTPKEIGCVLTSWNPFALDGVCGEIIGVGNMCPMLEESKKRGLLPADPENYRVLGEKIDKLRVDDFVFPDTTKKSILQKLPRFMEPRPVIIKNKCVGCGECARACPQKAIVIKNRKARINSKLCIKCYCCQELCKIQAVRIHRNIIYKLVH